MLNKQVCHLCFWSAVKAHVSDIADDSDKTYNLGHEQLNKLFHNTWDDCFCLCIQTAEKMPHRDIPVQISSGSSMLHRFWLRPVGSAPFQKCLYVTEQQVEQKGVETFGGPIPSPKGLL